MSAIISKILIFITVIVSFLIPGNVNGAVVTVDKEVKTTDSVIEYSVTNETGLVMADDTWVETLEIKVGDTWIAVPEIDEATEDVFYVNPGDAVNDSYNAGILAPGTYRITIGYNVVTEFDGTCTIGYSCAEFSVVLF